MVSSVSTSDLIAAIYDVPANAELWDVIGSKFLSVFDAAYFVAIQVSTETIGNEPPDAIILACNWPSDVMRLYSEYWHAHDPWVEHSHKVPDLTAAFGQDYYPQEEFERHPAWVDFARPYFDAFWMLTSATPPVRKWRTHLSMHRHHDDRSFNDTDKALFQELLPHINRSITVQAALRHTQETFDRSASLLESLAQAALILDGHGRVTYANEMAETLIAQADGIGLRADGTLRLSDPGDGRCWQKVLAQTCSGDVFQGGGTALAHRPSGKHALQILITPLPEALRALVGARGAALIVIRDPTRQPVSLRQKLMQVYSLTRREAEVFELVAHGKDVPAICDVLELGQETVRTYLKQLFQKTGCSRQSELAALAAGSPFSLFR